MTIPPPDALAAAHRLLKVEQTVMPSPPPGILADAFCVARALVEAERRATPKDHT